MMNDSNRNRLRVEAGSVTSSHFVEDAKGRRPMSTDRCSKPLAAAFGHRPSQCRFAFVNFESPEVAKKASGFCGHYYCL